MGKMWLKSEMPSPKSCTSFMKSIHLINFNLTCKVCCVLIFFELPNDQKNVYWRPIEVCRTVNVGWGFVVFAWPVSNVPSVLHWGVVQLLNRTRVNELENAFPVEKMFVKYKIAKQCWKCRNVKWVEILNYFSSFLVLTQRESSGTASTTATLKRAKRIKAISWASFV